MKTDEQTNDEYERHIKLEINGFNKLNKPAVLFSVYELTLTLEGEFTVVKLERDKSNSATYVVLRNKEQLVSFTQNLYSKGTTYAFGVLLEYPIEVVEWFCNEKDIKSVDRYLMHFIDGTSFTAPYYMYDKAMEEMTGRGIEFLGSQYIKGV